MLKRIVWECPECDRDVEAIRIDAPYGGVGVAEGLCGKAHASRICFEWAPVVPEFKVKITPFLARGAADIADRPSPTDTTTE